MKEFQIFKEFLRFEVHFPQRAVIVLSLVTAQHLPTNLEKNPRHFRQARIFGRKRTCCRSAAPRGESDRRATSGSPADSACGREIGRSAWNAAGTKVSFKKGMRGCFARSASL